MLSRRRFLALTAVGALPGCRFLPDDGIWNRCTTAAMPASLAGHELVQAAWDGIRPERFWDCHVHVIGTGDGGNGIWVNPAMDDWRHPIQFAQKKFYLNASCAEDAADGDAAYMQRLQTLQQDFPSGVRLMLLAFDFNYREDGGVDHAASAFYTPNTYAQALRAQAPQRYEWVASIHPYREDAVAALDAAVAAGARAIKWLPAAHGMNPGSPRCDHFYAAMARHDIPLLVHAGTELAVYGGNTESFGNPLLLRRPLDQGVRVIVAHCASLGSSVDIDRAPNADKLHNFTLFERLMNEHQYEGRLFGDISGITQINRAGNVLAGVVPRTDWHQRLVNGSDYPIPGVMPLFSVRYLVHQGFVREQDAAILVELRRYNPLLFDFVLKRSLRVDGRHLSNDVFETRHLFDKDMV